MREEINCNTNWKLIVQQYTEQQSLPKEFKSVNAAEMETHDLEFTSLNFSWIKKWLHLCKNGEWRFCSPKVVVAPMEINDWMKKDGKKKTNQPSKQKQPNNNNSKPNKKQTKKEKNETIKKQ